MRRFLFMFLVVPFLLVGEEKVVDLQRVGKVVYHFDEGLCTKIVRIAPGGEVRYEHQYHYDENQKLVAESLIGNLGKVEYAGSVLEGCLTAQSPYGVERWSLEDRNSYEELGVEKGYDEQGQLIWKGSNCYEYKHGKLVKVFTDNCDVYYAYDEKGRRCLKKTVSCFSQEEEYYLFLENNEIGSFSADGELKWLRIPGMTSHPDLVRAIAIETKDAVYAPIYDFQWNIVKLVDISDGRVIETRPDPFGQNLATLEGCPWTFCSKRYDQEAGLVHFGSRDYDPELREWTSLDPLKQDAESYRYCFNLPLQFIDPDGCFALAIPILVWTGGAITSPLWGPGALVVVGGAAVSYLGYKGLQFLQNEIDNAKPPYTWDDLGIDPSVCPDDGFVWKGSEQPEAGKGNWVRGEKPNQEKLNPDLNHPDPVGPHWDYHSPQFPKGVRIKPDGTWEHKSSNGAG